MADSKITDLAALSAQPEVDDLVPIVDISDTSMAASGTDKKIKAGELAAIVMTAVISAGRNSATSDSFKILNFDTAADANYNLKGVTDGQSWIPGVVVGILQRNATHHITVVPGTGVTVRTEPGVALTTGAQWSMLWLTYLGSDEWIASGAEYTAIDQSIGTAKGDIIGFTAASTPARIAAGADGTILRYNSATGTGLEEVLPTSALEALMAGQPNAKIGQSMDIHVAASSTPPVSGTIYAAGVGLRKGRTATGIENYLAVLGTVATLTLAKVALLDKNGQVLVRSGNLADATWYSGTQGLLSRSFGSSYLIPADDLYYAAMILVGTTFATFAYGRAAGLSATAAMMIGLGATQTGQADFPAVGGTVALTGVSNPHFYMGVIGS